MKNIICPLFLICLLGYSCTKEDVVPIFQPGPMTYGWAKGHKNGNSFTASGEARKHYDRPNEYFGIIFETYSTEGFKREDIVLSAIAYSTFEYMVSGKTPGVGETIVAGIAGGFYGTSTDDGDVGEDYYIVDESPNNKLTITELDTINNIVKGRFHVEFIHDPNDSKTNPNNPDKVVFSDMEFEVSFKQ